MKMAGKIKWFKSGKGYGYIIGADDETYFFSRNECINYQEEFNEGDNVLFEPEFGDEMDKAINVEKVPSYE